MVKWLPYLPSIFRPRVPVHPSFLPSFRSSIRIELSAMQTRFFLYSERLFDTSTLFYSELIFLLLLDELLFSLVFSEGLSQIIMSKYIYL